jgi:hypothetical protein
MVMRALRKQAQQGIRQPNLPDKWALVRPTIDLNPAANIPYGIILPVKPLSALSLKAVTIPYNCFPLDGAEIALKLKNHELVMPDMPLILKVLIKAEENRSRVHWHVAHDLTLRKQKDVMKSPFKDTRLEKGFGLKEAETLGGRPTPVHLG